MKRILILLAAGLIFSSAPAARAHDSGPWYVTSPEHGQTFAYGSEWHRSWAASPGPRRHLLFFITYTNEPYVDNAHPREYDYFSFDFPQVRLQPDGRTFSYLAPDGHAIPVARKSSGFLGIEEISLLPNSGLIIIKPHGYLTLTLQIEGLKFATLCKIGMDK